MRSSSGGKKRGAAAGDDRMDDGLELVERDPSLDER